MVALFGGADNAVELECVAGLGASGGDPAKIGLIGIGAGDAVSCLLGKGRRGGADEEASGKNRKAWRFSASQPRHGAKYPSPVPIARKSSTGLTLWLGRKGELFGLQPGFPVSPARGGPSISARVGPWHGCRQRIRYHPDTLPAGSRNYLDLNSAPRSSGAFCLCNFCVMCAGGRLIMTERYRSRVRSYALRTQ